MLARLGGGGGRVEIFCGFIIYALLPNRDNSGLLGTILDSVNWWVGGYGIADCKGYAMHCTHLRSIAQPVQSFSGWLREKLKVYTVRGV